MYVAAVQNVIKKPVLVTVMGILQNANVVLNVVEKIVNADALAIL